MKRRGVRAAALLVALIGCASVPALAQANVYNLSGPIVQRQGSVPSAVDFGYRGPSFVVTRFLATSVDTYNCPPGQYVSNWTVVTDRPDVPGQSYSQTGPLDVSSVTIYVTNWGHVSLQLRAMITCTTAHDEFRWPPPDWKHYPPGDYLPFWIAANKIMGYPPLPVYAELIQRVFCWSSTYPGCGKKAEEPKGAGEFALHNGTDALSLRFSDRSSTRPPAIHEAAPAGCAVQGMQALVEQRSGYLRLVLGCHGLRRGAKARVRLAQPLRRTFRLHQGNGSIRVRLPKPAGRPEPLTYLEYGPSNTACRDVRSQVRNRSRTLDLRIAARCGRAAGNAEAHLYIGGLLQ